MRAERRHRRLLGIRSAAPLADDHHVAESPADVLEQHAAVGRRVAQSRCRALRGRRRCSRAARRPPRRASRAPPSAATRTAGPTDAVVIEPHEFDANGNRSVSPRTVRTSSSRAPRTSAAICAKMVRAPVPRSCAPVSTSIVPSRLMRTVAYAGGPPPAPQMSDAIPTPRRMRPSFAALRARARSQPKRSAPGAVALVEMFVRVRRDPCPDRRPRSCAGGARADRCSARARARPSRTRDRTRPRRAPARGTKPSAPCSCTRSSPSCARSRSGTSRGRCAPGPPASRRRREGSSRRARWR